MTGQPNFFRRNAARFVAVAIIAGLFLLSQQPVLSLTERQRLAADFGFVASTLPELAHYKTQAVRDVHPDLKQIEAWLSAMGASVALNDLDGDGLPNDICQVDIRIDQVVVAPAPGTLDPDGLARFTPFALDPAPVNYDSTTMAPVGCLPNDMNEDGRMDILVYYWGRTPIAFLNQGDPSKSLTSTSYAPVNILPDGSVWWSSGATFADLDGDGHNDLVVSNYFQDDKVLLGSEGTDLISMQRSMSNALNGGDTHFFLWQEAASGADPMVQFTPVEDVLAEEHAHAWTLALAAADLDGDLLPELYFANDYGPDRLFQNRSQPGKLEFALLEGQRDLTTPKSKVLGADSFKGMGVDFGDINGDGLIDIFVSNIAADFALHESHFMFLNTGETAQMANGLAPFEDASEALGVARSSWSWETKLADFNNDSQLEALQATGFMKGEVDRWPELQELGLANDEMISVPRNWPRLTLGDDLNGSASNPFYVRSRSGRFFDLAAELGIDQEQVTRGIATADVDGDGDLDFAVANQWASSRFYENDCPGCGAFLGLNLLLPIADNEDGENAASGPAFATRAGHPGVDLVGRPAIGAVATVQLPDGRKLVNMVDGGNGQSGARSSDLHFGLGQVDGDTELAVELSWRDGDGQVRNEMIQVMPGWHTVLLGGRS